MSLENTTRNSPRGRVVLAAAAALTALLLALSFPPAGLAFLAWFALVPVLLVLGRADGKLTWIILCLAGWAFGIAGFFWVRHVTALGMILLGFYLSLYFLLFCSAVRWLSFRRRMPLAFSVPLVWVSLEVVRGLLLTGLPMLFLAHTQYKILSVIQIADLTGTAGVTFWIAAVNGLAADVVLHIRRPPPRTGRRRVLAAGIFVLMISTFALGYGLFRLGMIVTNEGPSIALIQANIPQDVKNRLTEENVADIFLKHVRMTNEAQSGDPPDLVIWPETMTPYGLFDHEYEGHIRAYLERLAAKGQLADGKYEIEHLRKTSRWRAMLQERQQLSSLLIGSGSLTVGDGRILTHNSVRLFPHKGRGATARYDKIHLVPFGEYIPLKPLIGWIVGPFIPFKDGLTPGTSRTVFGIDGSRFAVMICFEDMFPRLVAGFARGGRQPDFIVNITNEGWFKDGAELDQHLAVAVFRAVECRAGFVRSANTGISAFISPTGRIVSTLTVGGRDREVAGVLRGRAVSTDTRSPYLALGESLGWLCVAVCGLCLSVAAWPGVKLLVCRGRVRG